MLVRNQAQQTKTTDARCSYQGLMGGNYELLSISASAANLRERVTLAGIERGPHERASLGHGPHSFSVILFLIFFQLLSRRGDGCCHFLHFLRHFLRLCRS